MTKNDIDERCIKSIQQFVPDLVQAANSGHPGAPMGCAPIAHVLFSDFIVQNGKNAKWINADRFVLSNGHACALLYTMIHLRGYNLSMDDLKKFRQLGSKTPGHPERKHFDDGIDVSTGPLGQGISNAVGMAIASKNIAARYNKPDMEMMTSKIFVLLGDGCLQEGVQAEAISLAGHLKLGNLIAIYDDNGIQIDGSTDLAFTEDVLKRYEACGWHVQSIDNSKDLTAMRNAIKKAIDIKEKPSIIKIKTIIGEGSKNEGTEKVHGAPLGEEDIANVKKKLGFDPSKKFFIPSEVYEHYERVNNHCAEAENKWNALLKKYAEKYPNEYAEFSRIISKKLPENFVDSFPKYKPSDPAQATRKISETIITSIYNNLPEFIGGSADLTPSNLTRAKDSVDFQHESYNGSYSGKYIRFGVREHAMAAICNGISGFGFHIPFAATFLNFLGYAFGAIRLSALSKHQVIYIGTHDSIGLGEDGPTHQPIEIIALFRATPNLTTYRPADGNEVSASYLSAIQNTNGPSVIALTRQNLPNLNGSSIEKALMGGYILCDYNLNSGDVPSIILVGTGSEVSICVKAAEKLSEDKSISVRVVSLPSWEVFLKTPSSYRKSVFPPYVAVLSVEALSTFGWSKFSHMAVGINTFGESGNSNDLYIHFGITPENVVAKATQLMHCFKNTKPELKYGVSHG